MTNEEAKAVLIEHRRHELNQSEIGQAIDVAIQALSSQVDGGESILSQPDAERGKEERNPVESGQSDQDATEIIDPYVYNDYVGDPSDGNRVSFVFKEDAIRLMTEFASSKTSRLRAELDKAKDTITELIRQVSGNDGDMNDLKISRGKIANELVGRIEQVEALSSELSAAKEYNKSLMDNFEYETGKLESALSAANQRIAELEGQIQDLGSQM